MVDATAFFMAVVNVGKLIFGGGAGNPNFYQVVFEASLVVFTAIIRIIKKTIP